jgi:hypothetical protein
MAEPLTPAQKQALQDAKDAAIRKKETAAGAPVGDWRTPSPPPEKKAKGGSVGSASRRADGIAQRGKTKGRFV